MEKQALAQLLAQKVEYGSVSVAFYPDKVKTGAGEHKRQGNQFAKDHESFCIVNGELSVGLANAITNVPIWTTLKDISDKGTALLREFSLIAEGATVKVNDIALLTHGSVNGLEIAVIGADGYNGWVATHYADFTKKIAPYMADTVKVLMYGCGVAGETPVTDPFAEKIRRELYANLVDIYGAGGPTVEVWGHKDAGHTTANNRLVLFDGSSEGTYNGGTSMLDEFAGIVFEDKLTERGVNSDTITNAAQKKRLMAACYSAVLRALQGASAIGKPTDEQGLAYTDPDHPVNTLLRDLPWVGIYNFWNELRATATPDFSHLVLTPDAIARMEKALLVKRKRVDTELAELNDTFKNVH